MLIENYPCENKLELLQRERYWTNQIDCINKYKNQGQLLKLGRKEYSKQYHENNKHKTKAKNSQKYSCECGSVFRYGEKARHQKSKKHQDFINS